MAAADAPPVGNRWLEETGGTRGPEYAARFAALADEGADVHGEARFLDALLTPGSDVIDAGCGTGRIAIELARRGHRTHGIDLDASMLDQARSAAPQLRWTLADLLDVEVGSDPDPSRPDGSGPHGSPPDPSHPDPSHPDPSHPDPSHLDGADVVDGSGRSGVAGEAGVAGVSPGTGVLDGPVDLVVAAGNVMVYLAPGTERDVVAHLAGWLRPGGSLVVGFAADRHVSPLDHDRWCAAAGLVPVAAHTAWDPSAPAPDGSSEYAVLVHRRPERIA